jgi:phosphoribosyl-AMP cyclohydrolase
MVKVDRDIPGLDREVVQRVVDRLIDLEPTGLAVVVRGSYAWGTSDRQSDFDVSVIVPQRRQGAPEWRTWFEERREGTWLHVSAGTHSVEEWLASRDRPAPWALGFPALSVAEYLWATDEGRAALGEPPSNPHPPGRSSLEEFIEAIAKSKRAADRNDAIGLRWHARAAGAEVPGLLRDLNPDRTVHDRREAIQAALDLPVAPEHYREDFAAVMGLRPESDAGVRRAVMRLASELLAFLRERNPSVDEQPGLAQYLADGTLERHLGLVD